MVEVSCASVEILTERDLKPRLRVLNRASTAIMHPRLRLPRARRQVNSKLCRAQSTSRAPRHHKNNSQLQDSVQRCILGVWFQIYEFNRRDRTPIAKTVYFLAFFLLVISGIVELSVDLFSIRTMKETIDSTPDRIDLLANWLVYVDAILNVVLRHVELSVKFLDDETNRIELAVVILLLITAVLYVSADVIRIKSSGGGGSGTQQLQSAQKTPTPTQQTDV
eukprot:scaffold14338_cov176-Skeletonema_marinoi.AAC.2